MVILLNLVESRSPFHPIIFPSCYYMTDSSDVLTGHSIRAHFFLKGWINKYESKCTPAQVCESSQIAASPASKKCPKLPGLLEKTKQKQNKKKKQERGKNAQRNWLSRKISLTSNSFPGPRQKQGLALRHRRLHRLGRRRRKKNNNTHIKTGAKQIQEKFR